MLPFLVQFYKFFEKGRRRLKPKLGSERWFVPIVPASGKQCSTGALHLDGSNPIRTNKKKGYQKVSFLFMAKLLQVDTMNSPAGNCTTGFYPNLLDNWDRKDRFYSTPVIWQIIWISWSLTSSGSREGSEQAWSSSCFRQATMMVFTN